LRVLDITEDSVYVVDDHYDHYSYLDTDSDHDYLNTDDANSWAEEYAFRVPIPDFEMSESHLYTVDFSNLGFTLYKDYMGTPAEIHTDTDAAFVLPPGDIEVTLLLSTSSSWLTYKIVGGDIHGDDVRDGQFRSHIDDISDYEVTLEDILEYPPVLHIPAEFQKYVQTEPEMELVEVTIPLTLERWMTTTMFITELKAEFVLHFNPFKSCKLVGIEVRDVFNVFAGGGLNDRMTLPVGSSGLLSDMSFEIAKPVISFPADSTALTMDIYNPSDPPTPDASFTVAPPHSWRYDYPYPIESGDISGQSLLLFDTQFDSEDESENDIPQYSLEVTKGTGSAAIWLKYLWKVREDDGAYTTGPDVTRWATISSVGISRSSVATLPTEIGRMLPAEIDEDFAPFYCLDTQKLGQQGRKYIDYAGYGDQQATMANPITLQADGLGGGILSYGLSTSITADHIWSNSSMSGVFLQMVASHNFMNLWGASPKTDTISEVRLGVEEYDELTVIGQEGWINEWFDGNGILDTFERYGTDENGADWYTIPYTQDKVYSFDDTMELRQPSQELSSWDVEGRELAEELGFLEDLFNHPLIRYPMVRADFIEFDLDLVDIQAELAAGDLYMKVELRIRGVPYTKDILLTSGMDPTIKIDLEELSPMPSSEGLSRAASSWFAEAYQEYENRILYNSRDPEIEVSSPLLITTIYRDDPETLAVGDTLAHVNNLVYFDYHYQRIKIDRDYVAEYKSKWNQEEVNHAAMKPVMVIVGCVFVVAGAFAIATAPVTGGWGVLAGIPTIVFGMDMITGNLFGFSLMDEGLKMALRGAFTLAGKDGSFIGYGHEFSFFQFTSSSVANLFLTQLTFMVVGGVLSGGAGLRGSLQSAVSKISKGTGGAVRDAMKWLMGLETGTSTFMGGFRVLRTAGTVGREAIKYVWHMAKHFLQGTMFLFTLGAIGTAFGDGGLFAEIALQGLLVASIVASIGQRRYMQKMTEFDSTLYSEAMTELETVGSERSFLARKLLQLKESWSIFQDYGNPKLQQTFRMLIALNFATVGLQFATVAAQAYG
jgi:hypothetical protein